MTGRVGIDFGTSNSVIAVWDEALHQGVPFHLPDYGMILQQGDEEISVVPSVIHYGPGQVRWIGNQVHEQNLYNSPRTFRWMKRYISNRSPIKLRLDGGEFTPFTAGEEFLSTVLRTSAAELELGEEEVALTTPVEAFEHYEDWLSGVALEAGIARFRLIDEPSAAALGYGVEIQPGDVYIIFDFGGGTHHAAVVLIEEDDLAATKRRCRILGKAGMDIGGMTLDQWIFEDVLEANSLSDDDQSVRQVSNALLADCERAKIRLSFHPRADISVVNPNTGAVLSAEFTRQRFEEVLDKHDAFAIISRTLQRALNDAHERGYTEENVKAVLMVGGSSQIPGVQQTLQRTFGRDLVKLHRPLDAIARGAAAYAAGVDFYDHIQHDYGVRYVNREENRYDYRVIVPRGTPYPTSEPVAQFTVKAAYNEQENLGLAIFELGQGRAWGGENPVELVFDPSGSARLSPVGAEDDERRRNFWMNEGNPTFLTADPPAKQGEPRFEVSFTIDGNKRLLISARDLITGKIAYKDYPVVKLT